MNKKRLSESDLINTKVQYLTLKRKYQKSVNNGPLRSYWECVCDCGKIVHRREDYILYGKTHSCGCQHPRHRKGKDTKQWGGVGELSGQYFASIKASAKKRNLEFDIDINYIWKLYQQQKGLCALSGIKLQFHPGGRKNRILQTASLDRKDPNLGYIKGNVWWVHKTMNLMRHHYELDVFFSACNAVAKLHPTSIDTKAIDEAIGTRNASTGRSPLKSN